MRHLHLEFALGAGASHKAVSQKLPGSFTVKLLNGLLHQLSCLVQCVEDALQAQTTDCLLTLAQQSMHLCCACIIVHVSMRSKESHKALCSTV